MGSPVAVPVIFIVFSDQVAVTPVGNPIAVPIPVAPVVLAIGIGSSVKMVWPNEISVAVGAIAVLSVQGVTGVTVTVGVDPPAALSATTEKE